MQWSYHLRSTILATTSKFKMAAIFETSYLFVRRYTFFPSFPRPMFSRVRNAMKLSFLFYDRSNYRKLLWELQIYVSIIYSLLRKSVLNVFHCNTFCGQQNPIFFEFDPKCRRIWINRGGVVNCTKFGWAGRHEYKIWNLGAIWLLWHKI